MRMARSLAHSTEMSMDALKELLEAQHNRTELARERRLTRTLGWSAATGPSTGLGTGPESGASSLEAASVCPLCEGARFVRTTADPDDPDFGTPVPCECVRSEDARVRHDRLLRYSRLGALGRMTFGTLLRRGRTDDVEAQRRYEQAVVTAERFADHPEGWLVLSGVPGCGKTHLAAAIATRALERGTPALFFAVADLLDQLRASYGDDAELPYERLLEQLRNAPLVILDDLDAFAETPWAREKFLQLVSHRFHAALPTVFTCERSPQDLDARLAARLTDPAMSQLLVLQEATAPLYTNVGAMTRARLLEFSFERFNPGGRGLRGKVRDNLEGAYRLTREWAEAPHGWLVLVGKNGSGKTHLAAAAAAYRLERGERVCFANVPDLLDELRATFAPGTPGRFDRVFQPLLDAPLLVLDDLGAQQTSPWAQEKLYQLINHRHLARAHTIVTTNIELGAMEPRIASRLSDLDVSVVYEITAPDFRLGGV
jgi:DNA replication protein DnaC